MAEMDMEIELPETPVTPTASSDGANEAAQLTNNQHLVEERLLQFADYVSERASSLMNPDLGRQLLDEFLKSTYLLVYSAERDTAEKDFITVHPFQGFTGEG